MAVCDIGQSEPAALLLSDLAFSRAGRPPRWSIWPRGKFDRPAGPSAGFFRSPMGIGLPCSLIN